MKLAISFTAILVLVFASAALVAGAQPAGASGIDWALSAAPRVIDL